jgi:GNAT superfamily N-acetyltransferase
LPQSPAIVRARREDAGELRRVAIESKGHWGYAPEWLARFAAMFEITPPQVEERPFYCIRDGDCIAAWYSLKRSRESIDGTPDEVLILEDLWIAHAAIGRGWGRLLFEHAVERAKERGARRLEWEADPNAVPFYLHMGAVVTGDVETSMGRRIPTMALDLD